MWGRIKYFYGNSMDPIEVESKLRQYLEKPMPMKGEHFFSQMVVDKLDIFVKTKKIFGINR